jgi:hypothetical protein
VLYCAAADCKSPPRVIRDSPSELCTTAWATAACIPMDGVSGEVRGRRPHKTLPMADEACDYLIRQFETAWKLTNFHLDGLTTKECLRRLAHEGLHVHQASDGINERLVEQAGFRLIRPEDVTDNAALVAGRWPRARHAHRDDLLRIEGEERFEGLQRFFEAVRRLSRIAYLAESCRTRG